VDLLVSYAARPQHQGSRLEFYPRRDKILHKATGRPNKRMQLTKLRAAPVWQAEVPPCAPAGRTGGGTASQLIRSVGQTVCRAMRR
jgi:hypothetical protein